MGSSMNKYELFKKEIEEARHRETVAIPLPYVRIRQDLDIGRNMYYLVMGGTGTGKSAFTHWTFALYPYLWYRQHKKDTNIKLKIFVRSLERSFELTLAKWISMWIYLKTKHKVIVDPLQVISRRKSKMTDEHYELVKQGADFFANAEEHLELIAGDINPTGIYMHMKEWAEKNGTFQQSGKYEKDLYIPNDPNLITIYIVDHIGKVSTERLEGSSNKNKNTPNPVLTEKQKLDRTTSYLTQARDRFGFSPVVVQQTNRNQYAIGRRSALSLIPEKGDLEGTSKTGQDADSIIAIINPHEFQEKKWQDYNIEKTISSAGYSRFRGLSFIKTSWGGANFNMGMQFIGENGYYGEIQSPKSMTSDDYNLYFNIDHKKL